VDSHWPVAGLQSWAGGRRRTASSSPDPGSVFCPPGDIPLPRSHSCLSCRSAGARRPDRRKDPADGGGVPVALIEGTCATSGGRSHGVGWPSPSTRGGLREVGVHREHIAEVLVDGPRPDDMDKNASAGISEDGPAVPRGQVADLVLAQSGQSLTCLEKLLKRSPATRRETRSHYCWSTCRPSLLSTVLTLVWTT
jgi:hypothetical protein